MDVIKIFIITIITYAIRNGVKVIFRGIITSGVEVGARVATPLHGLICFGSLQFIVKLII